MKILTELMRITEPISLSSRGGGGLGVPDLLAGGAGARAERFVLLPCFGFGLDLSFEKGELGFPGHQLSLEQFVVMV